MRTSFLSAILQLANDSRNVFLTGDLGFNVLEPAREAFGKRFFNCGIAEQNMVGVAAGLARAGMKVFCYSIAPFIYARPFEFIRNDIVAHNLPVCLVGNGGGYHYGSNGPTHHALEDCVAMKSLGVNVLVPCFSSDIDFMLKDFTSPTYLRLGRDCLSDDTFKPTYSPWRRLLEGQHGVWVTLGPISGLAFSILTKEPQETRPALWCCAEFNLPPIEFWSDMKDKLLTVFEEHVETGGLASMLMLEAAKKDTLPSRLVHHYALGYPSKTFGRQDFHRAECGLDICAMRKVIEAQRVCA